jgi:hypothetical protein
MTISTPHWKRNLSGFTEEGGFCGSDRRVAELNWESLPLTYFVAMSVSCWIKIRENHQPVEVVESVECGR